MFIKFILKVSSIIHKKKEKIVNANRLEAIGLAFVVIFLEIFQFVVSLPTYIFIKPEKFSTNKKEVNKYILKRKYSFLGLFGFLAIILLKITLTGSLVLSGPRVPVRASFVS
jgi:hypothetical protein